MIKIENSEVLGWEHAIRGMRNPMNSWEKSDSFWCMEGEDVSCIDKCPKWENCRIYDDDPHYIVGNADYDLMMRLRNAGTDHRKYMRMIAVYVDVTAPLYWWKEFDTYKVGTVANSCSTMHKIAAKEFTLEDFSHEHVTARSLELLIMTVKYLNECRDLYINYEISDNGGFPKPTKKELWWQMIQLLPSSYNQRRTVMLNYEVLANIYKSRKNHKLDEWREFCTWVKSLPYSEIITGSRE